MDTQKQKRSAFSGKIGFVLSAAGASVGLGNIWRFPYLAAKYGGDGKQIDIDLKRDGGNIVASVRDYGQGIPEAELPFVKEKFYKGSSKQRGSGIGLAVTEEIVSMHGGTLDIASEVGKGTTVTVTLPSAKSEEALGITGAIPKASETPFTEGEHS